MKQGTLYIHNHVYNVFPLFVFLHFADSWITEHKKAFFPRKSSPYPHQHTSSHIPPPQRSLKRKEKGLLRSENHHQFALLLRSSR